MRRAFRLLFLLFPALAFAQADVLPPAPVEVKSELLRVFVQYLLVPIAVGLAGLLGVVFLSLRKWLEATAQSTLLGKAASKLNEVLFAVVQDIAAHEKADLEEYARDGVITAAEAKALKEKAIARAKTVLGEQGLLELKEAFGFGAAQLEQHLSGKVEQMVAAAKVAQDPK